MSSVIGKMPTGGPEVPREMHGDWERELDLFADEIAAAGPMASAQTPPIGCCGSSSCSCTTTGHCQVV